MADSTSAQLVLIVKLFLDAFEMEFTEGDEQRGYGRLILAHRFLSRFLPPLISSSHQFCFDRVFLSPPSPWALARPLVAPLRDSWFE
jgi:hypothetical protein